MGASAIVRRIIGNHFEYGICRSLGIDRRTCFRSSGMINRGYGGVDRLNDKPEAELQRLLAAKDNRIAELQRLLAAKDEGYVQSWNNKLEVAEKRKLLLPCFAKPIIDRGYVVLAVEQQQFRLDELVRIPTKDSQDNKLEVEQHQRQEVQWLENWKPTEDSENKFEVEQQLRLLLQEVQIQEWMKNFKGSLLTIQRLNIKGREGIIEIITSTPQTRPAFEKSARLDLEERPGPYNLPTQAVEDVVCITTKDAFLLYNATTRDASPWIETAAAREGRQVETIALGFDPRSKKHKVVCMSSYLSTAPQKDYEPLVVEVLDVCSGTWTTGQHEWRKLKYAKDEYLPSAFREGKKSVFLDGPVYFDGKIHWHYRQFKSIHLIMEFDVGKEVFGYIPFDVPVRQDFQDPFQRSKLMGVDGKIAFLTSKLGEETSSLWTCLVTDRDAEWPSIEWDEEEEVLIPCDCVCPTSSIEALTGTDVIFVQSHGRTTYCNRKMKVSLTSPVSNPLNGGRIMQL